MKFVVFIFVLFLMAYSLDVHAVNWSVPLSIKRDPLASVEKTQELSAVVKTIFYGFKTLTIFVSMLLMIRVGIKVKDQDYQGALLTAIGAILVGISSDLVKRILY